MSTELKTHELAASNDVSDSVALLDSFVCKSAVDIRPAIDGGKSRYWRLVLLVLLEVEGAISPEPEYW